jgi:hypothetical protein
MRERASVEAVEAYLELYPVNRLVSRPSIEVIPKWKAALESEAVRNLLSSADVVLSEYWLLIAADRGDSRSQEYLCRGGSSYAANGLLLVYLSRRGDSYGAVVVLSRSLLEAHGGSLRSQGDLSRG